MARIGFATIGVGLLTAALYFAAVPRYALNAAPEVAAKAWFAETSLGSPMPLRFSGERDVRRPGSRTPVETFHRPEREPFSLLRNATRVDDTLGISGVSRFLLLLQLRL